MDSLVVNTQHPDSLKRIQELESTDKNVHLEVPEPEFRKPNWIRCFDNIDNLQEGEVVHLIGYVEPVGDPDLKVEWYLNGAPLKNCKFVEIYSLTSSTLAFEKVNFVFEYTTSEIQEFEVIYIFLYC